MIGCFTIRQRRMAAWCLCLFFESLLAASNENDRQLSYSTLQPKMLSNGSYSDVYKLSLILEDRTFIQVQMIVTNIGLSDSNAGCELLVLLPGEKPWRAGKRFNKHNWSYSNTPNPALSIGQCRLEQLPGTTRCAVAIDKATAAIVIDRPPGQVKTPAILNVGGEGPVPPSKASKIFCDFELLLPWSKLQATLHLPGFPEKNLQGYGTLEHSRSVGYPRDFSRGAVSYYGCREGCRFLARFRFPVNDTSTAIGWVWKDGDQSPQPLTGLRISTESQAVNGKNRTFKVMSVPDKSFAMITRQELYRSSIIDDLGPIIGTIVKLLVGNPVVRFYDAQVQLSPEQPPANGILELMRFE